MSGETIRLSEQEASVLTEKEQKMFLKKAKEGDVEARNQLILHNIRLVKSIIFKEIPPYGSLDYEDLIQEGVFGLIRAIEKYEEGKETKFSTYASFWIKQSVQRALVDKSRMIRLPNAKALDIAKVMATKNKLSSYSSTEPTSAEIADILGFTEEYVDYCKKINKLSLTSGEFVKSDEGDEISLFDLTETDKKGVEDVVLQKDLRKNLFEGMNDCLTQKEKIVILKRYGFEGGECQTLDSIGKSLNLTRERIRQIEKRALEKLGKKSIVDKYLQGYS